MEKRINEIGGYDDQIRQKLTQHEFAVGSAEAYNLLTLGFGKLEHFINTLGPEDELKKELRKSLYILFDELMKIYDNLHKFSEENLEGKFTKLDSMSYGFQKDLPTPSLNETTIYKINETIERIKEVNKKLNKHGK